MRVLFVANDESMINFMEVNAKAQGIGFDFTQDIEEALHFMDAYDYNAIVLNCTSSFGLDLLRAIKGNDSKAVPVFVIAHDTSAAFSIQAHDLGADGFIRKPFDKRDFFSRLKTMVRLSNGHSSNVISIGELTVNLDRQTLSVSGAQVRLTGKEYKMIEILALRKGAVVTKDMFLNHLYNGMDEPEMKIIDVFICKVRAKLRAASGGEHYIQTVWGRGYTLPIVQDFVREKHDPTPVHSNTAEEELRAIREDVARMRNAIGADPDDDIDTVLKKLALANARAEDQLQDDLSDSSDGEIEKDQSEDGMAVRYEGGVRVPVGGVIDIGSIIQLDSSSLMLGNKKTGAEVQIGPAVASFLEIVSYFQGRQLAYDLLSKALFEEDKPVNRIKLNQIMVEAQAALNELVGREFAAIIVQGTTQGIGMPQGILAIEGRFGGLEP